MPSSCKEIRKALAECLQESECVMVQRHKASDCLREPLVDTLPVKCRQLKKGFGECKRGMIDMRKRFRGNQPVALKALQEADKGEGYQLYAGKSAFQSVRPTDGKEEVKDWREVENEQYRAQLAREELKRLNKK
ncbi:hypothetical protein MKZ38_004621 [Zalerion maritima]|uniref:Cytochrome c oxidase assembly factor 5 n=1 Tax=Zalerion maritima TaxID=339359 RepID=A0AAD5WPS9_9PEZI|nr:hypothetical protein MKZ38_004621 [Zalerion maritima]